LSTVSNFVGRSIGNSAGIGATQDFASHDTAQPKQAEQIWPISQQPSGSREIRKKRHVAQPSTPRSNRDATVFQTPADS
jgi:hypothetical protein